MKEKFELYKLELAVSADPDDSTGLMDMALTGRLTHYGKALLKEDARFKALIDALTLASSKVVDEHYGGDAQAKEFSGAALDAPGVKEFLEESGVKVKETS